MMARKEHRELDGRLTITNEGIPDPPEPLSLEAVAKAVVSVAQRSTPLTKAEAEALLQVSKG